MQYRPLGRTDIKVSVIGLGTMTFGEQNTRAEAHQQLDYAFDQGVNLVDTAEMYPVAPRAETQGATERIIGHWIAHTGKRAQLVLATKVAGPSAALGLNYIRGGQTHLDRANIVTALHDSLERLQTDYIDLYQLHWPERPTNYFGKLGYVHQDATVAVQIEDTLLALSDQVRAGKIRYIGVSNETPWGVHRFLQAATALGLERIVSIQNPYNLLNRSFEVGLAEMAMRENVGLLAYSPLAFGVLTGKYLHGAKPDGARLTRWTRFSRYNSDNAVQATTEYVQLAREHQLDPGQMALAYVNTRPFLASTLIGATTMEQLRSNLGSVALTLSAEVLTGIEAIQQRWPNPAP